VEDDVLKAESLHLYYPEKEVAFFCHLEKRVISVRGDSGGTGLQGRKYLTTGVSWGSPHSSGFPVCSLEGEEQLPGSWRDGRVNGRICRTLGTQSQKTRSFPASSFSAHSPSMPTSLVFSRLSLFHVPYPIACHFFSIHSLPIQTSSSS
jgi:hypothetical protein